MTVKLLGCGEAGSGRTALTLLAPARRTHGQIITRGVPGGGAPPASHRAGCVTAADEAVLRVGVHSQPRELPSLTPTRQEIDKNPSTGDSKFKPRPVKVRKNMKKTTFVRNCTTKYFFLCDIVSQWNAAVAVSYFLCPSVCPLSVLPSCELSVCLSCSLSIRPPRVFVCPLVHPPAVCPPLYRPYACLSVPLHDRPSGVRPFAHPLPVCPVVHHPSVPSSACCSPVSFPSVRFLYFHLTVHPSAHPSL